MNKYQLIKEILDQTEIGKLIVNMQMTYLRSLKDRVRA